MDSEELRAIMKGGESLIVEFKRDVDDRELVEAVACLANSEGGRLLIGVDNDGTLVGAKPRHGSLTNADRLIATVRNRTEHPLSVEVELVSVDGFEVILITVPAAETVIATSTGTYVRRVIGPDGRPQCVPMRPHEVIARAGTIGATDYSKLPLRDAVFERDIDPSQFERLRRFDSIGGDNSLLQLPDEEILRALEFQTVDGVLTAGAILMFGSAEALERFTPAYEIGTQELDRLEVRSSTRSRVPLLQAFEELEAWVQLRNPEEEIEMGLFRVALPRFTAVALRELIANALVHRDFSLLGPTLIEVDERSLEISNPGGFPAGVTVDNVLRTPPRARNPAIADAFKRLGLVERTSRGINRAFESQLSAGRAAPDYSRTTPTSVAVRLRSGPSDRELAAFVSQSRKEGRRVDVNDLLILHEIRAEGRVTSARAAQLFQLSEAEARGILNRLVESGMLEARGERKGRTYHMGAGLYRELGDPAGYVRTKGFDEAQQMQMILNYAEHHGSITRSEAADLCLLDPVAAGYVLRKMRDAGKLEMVGQKRGARYVLPKGAQ